MMLTALIKERKLVPVIFLLVIAIGLVTAAMLYLYVDKYSLLFYWDAVSHLVAARKLVDWSENPGVGQIGTVWMPLPHFLLLPFAILNSLFFTGFAGTALSLPCLGLTSVYLYKIITSLKIVRTSAAYSTIGFVGAMLYATNPNILYLGITSMTEAPFMLFFVASAFYFQSWLASHAKSMRSLFFCSVFLALATLCRYEAWFLPIFLVLVAIGFELKNRNIPEFRRRGFTALVSILSLTSIAFWLTWNQYHYGDPFEFSNAEYYSAAWYAENRPIREILFLQPANVLSVYGLTALTMYGPVLLGAGAIGYYFFRKESLNYKKLLLLFMALPPIFTMVSLVIGIGEMAYWFNSRFMVLLSPLVIVMACLLLVKFTSRVSSHRIIIMMLGALFAYQIVAIPAIPAVITMNDAVGGYSVKENILAIETAESLKSIYDGSGKIMVLTGSGLEQRIMITSGIPLSSFDEIIEPSTWKASFKEPWSYDRWLIITNKPGSDALTTTQYWLDRQDELSRFYDIAYQNEYYKIMVLR